MCGKRGAELLRQPRLLKAGWLGQGQDAEAGRNGRDLGGEVRNEDVGEQVGSRVEIG